MSDDQQSLQATDPLPIEDRFTVGTLFRYLIGNAAAIRTVAACRYSVLIGGLLVLSAGFAREYDGEDLLSEPWHLLIPHAASIATSMLLYAMVVLPGALWAGKFRQFIAGYPTFLGLFWMTAPAAWIYAIPVERFLSAAQATESNLWMLGIVSVWRVVLITRVIVVHYDVSQWKSALATVLLFGDLVMLVALSYVPFPVLRMMGGVRMTDSERVLANTKMMLILLGLPSLLVLGLIFLFTLWRPCLVESFSLRAKSIRANGKLWILAAVSILIWVGLLPLTQPAQQRRRRVEQEMANGQFRSALVFMSTCELRDFPPHWRPPPQVGFSKQTCEIEDVVDAMLSTDVAPWVRSTYSEKFRRHLGDILGFWDSYDEQKLQQCLRLMLAMETNEWRETEITDIGSLESHLEYMTKEDNFLEGGPISEETMALVSQALRRLGNDP